MAFSSIGSLSVFETRTTTGSELISLLSCPHTTTFALLSIFSPLEMGDNTVLVCEMFSSGCRPFGQKTGIATSSQVQHQKPTIHGLPVTLRMPRVKPDKSDWFWSQSIVFTKPFKTGLMSLDLARGPDLQRMTKGTPGDEVAYSLSWWFATSP